MENQVNDIVKLYKFWKDSRGYENSQLWFFKIMKSQFQYLFQTDSFDNENLSFNPVDYQIDLENFENFEKSPLNTKAFPIKFKKQFPNWEIFIPSSPSPSSSVSSTHTSSSSMNNIVNNKTKKVIFNSKKRFQIKEFDSHAPPTSCSNHEKQVGQKKVSGNLKPSSKSIDPMEIENFCYQPAKKPVMYPHPCIKGIIIKLYNLTGFPPEFAQPNDLAFNLEVLGFCITNRHKFFLNVIDDKIRETKFLRNIIRDLKREADILKSEDSDNTNKNDRNLEVENSNLQHSVENLKKQLSLLEINYQNEISQLSQISLDNRQRYLGIWDQSVYEEKLFTLKTKLANLKEKYRSKQEKIITLQNDYNSLSEKYDTIWNELTTVTNDFNNAYKERLTAVENFEVEREMLKKSLEYYKSMTEKYESKMGKLQKKRRRDKLNESFHSLIYGKYPHEETNIADSASSSQYSVRNEDISVLSEPWGEQNKSKEKENESYHHGSTDVLKYGLDGDGSHYIYEQLKTNKNLKSRASLRLNSSEFCKPRQLSFWNSLTSISLMGSRGTH